MSLDVRFFTNGEKEIYVITNSGVTPVERNVYNSVDEVPKGIRHYAETTKQQFCEPDFAHLFGVQEILYPGIARDCVIPDQKPHVPKRCIFEQCRHNKGRDEKYACGYKEHGDG